MLQMEKNRDGSLSTVLVYMASLVGPITFSAKLFVQETAVSQGCVGLI